jgi:transposase
MNYIGLDIHKKNTQACVKNDSGKALMNVRFPSTPEGINELLDKIEPLGAASVVMEATGFCMYIYDIVEARGYDVKVAHPSKVKALTAGRAKTDKNDAEMLAELLRLDAIPESYIPPKESRELREMTRFRQSLVGRSVDLRNEIHAVLAARGLRPPTGLRTEPPRVCQKGLPCDIPPGTPNRHTGLTNNAPFSRRKPYLAQGSIAWTVTL